MEKGAQAIWYYPKFKDWAIGDLKDIGSNRRGITSVADQEQSIFDVANDEWKYTYYNKLKVVQNGDIIVKCCHRAALLVSSALDNIHIPTSMYSQTSILFVSFYLAKTTMTPVVLIVATKGSYSLVRELSINL